MFYAKIMIENYSYFIELLRVQMFSYMASYNQAVGETTYKEMINL